MENKTQEYPLAKKFLGEAGIMEFRKFSQVYKGCFSLDPVKELNQDWENISFSEKEEILKNTEKAISSPLPVNCPRYTIRYTIRCATSEPEEIKFILNEKNEKKICHFIEFFNEDSKKRILNYLFFRKKIKEITPWLIIIDEQHREIKKIRKEAEEIVKEAEELVVDTFTRPFRGIGSWLLKI
jgi:hypothetical protein